MQASGKLGSILRKAIALSASDVHLSSGARLRIRVNGDLTEKGSSELPAAAAEEIIYGALSAEQRQELEERGGVDLALAIEGGGRCRCNVFRQQRGLGAVFRLIPDEPMNLRELELPATLEKLTGFKNGLVLVTGPAGSGKTSTIAALLDIININRRDHIITIEDPIEILHASKGCLVNQRQVGLHTRGFGAALRAALREDPDVMMVGELRDLETISLAIRAAETGHLVFSTIHTRTSVQSVNRMINVFPPSKQSQIRAQLADSLRAVISQRLVMGADGTKRYPALEILVVTPAIRGLIRDDKTMMISSTQQLGKEGMCLLGRSLAELINRGAITREEALRHVQTPQELAY